MAKLALAIGEGAQLGDGWARLPVSRRSAREAYRNLGELVLLYTAEARASLSFVGVGRIEGLDFVSSDLQACRFGEYRTFAAPYAGAPDELNAPGVGRYLSLDDARHDEIVEAGTSASAVPGVHDVATAFAPASASGGVLQLRSEVLQRWGYCCCVTDTPFAPSDAASLRVVPIRPVARGGLPVVENYLPMVELAEHAWLTGAISVSDSRDFVAVQNRLDADLLQVMPRNGKLIVPDNPAHAPSREALAWHRANIFGR